MLGGCCDWFKSFSFTEGDVITIPHNMACCRCPSLFFRDKDTSKRSRHIFVVRVQCCSTHHVRKSFAQNNGGGGGGERKGGPPFSRPSFILALG